MSLNFKTCLYLSIYKGFILSLAWKFFFFKSLGISEIEPWKLWRVLFSSRHFDFVKTSIWSRSGSYLRVFLSLAILGVTQHGHWPWPYSRSIRSSNHPHWNAPPRKKLGERNLLVPSWPMVSITGCISGRTYAQNSLRLFPMQGTMIRAISAKIGHGKQINQHILHRF